MRESHHLFKLSKPVIIVYNDADIETKVKKVLSHIEWLLQESQNPVITTQSGERSRVKK